MRVVHIAKVSGIAGSERQLLTLLPGLRVRGLDVRMLVLEGRATAAPFCDRLRETGIAVERIPIHGDIDFGLTARIGRALRRLAPQVVHTHLLHADLYGLRAAAAAGVPAVVSSRHNTDRFRRRMWVRLLNARSMRHAHRIIAISHAVADFLVRVERCDPTRVVTIPYGFVMPRLSGERTPVRNRLGYLPSDRVVAVIARLTAQKGVDVLIDAFARVRQSHPPARLLIVGDGPDRARLEQLASDVRLDGTVQFAGWIDESFRVLPGCDVVVVPSRWEGFCLAAVEGMASGRPVVASNVDALREVIVDGETGLLVPPDDPAALARAIVSVLDDPDRAAALGAGGRARAERAFPVDRMIESTADVYADLLAPAGYPRVSPGSGVSPSRT